MPVGVGLQAHQQARLWSDDLLHAARIIGDGGQVNLQPGRALWARHDHPPPGLRLPVQQRGRFIGMGHQQRRHLLHPRLFRAFQIDQRGARARQRPHGGGGVLRRQRPRHPRRWQTGGNRRVRDQLGPRATRHERIRRPGHQPPDFATRLRLRLTQPQHIAKRHHAPPSWRAGRQRLQPGAGAGWAGVMRVIQQRQPIRAFDLAHAARQRAQPAQPLQRLALTRPQPHSHCQRRQDRPRPVRANQMREDDRLASGRAPQHPPGAGSDALARPPSPPEAPGYSARPARGHPPARRQTTPPATPPPALAPPLPDHPLAARRIRPQGWPLASSPALRPAAPASQNTEAGSAPRS